ncbi:kinase-like protein, partial [Yamadazyma tenuis ATCC 10573]
MSNPNRLSYHPDPSSGSLKDINDDLDKIFNTYTSNYSNNSNDTLDSETAPPPISSTSKHHRLIPPTVLDRFSATNDYSVHISSRLSSLKQGSADVIHSAPQSPNSGSSFDFYSQDHRAMSNGSLDILNTPIIEQELKDIISPEKYGEVAKSNEALKSLNLEDDEIPSSIAVSGTKSEDWHERGAATRTVGDESNGFTVIRRNVTDFEFGKPLGEGSYSTVVLATDKITSTKYAVKILDKRHIIKEKKVKYVNIEKHALNRLSNRMGVVSLYFTFQDKDSLYFVLDYASNGELLSLIKKYNTLNEDCVRYFGAQILDAIKYMHDNGVIHRDIKPENILLDDKLRIQITDFGTARLLEKVSEESEEYPVDVRAKSFVGTAEYVSPELLDNKYCGKPGDIWAFGCILYQMIAGKPPFKAANEYLTFQKITKLQYAFSAGFPLVMRDLIKQVLVLQPSRRADIPTIQKHYFFQGINFDDFNQIWYSEVPELGPFKMSAKSMMKIPELSKSASSQSVATKRVPRKKDKRTVSEPSHNGNNNAKVSTASSAGAPLNPAAAAAFVLNKKEDSSDTEDSADTATDDIPNNTQTSSRTSSRAPSSAPSSAPLPDYIPGTNILRPTINSIHSYSRSSSRTKPQRKPKFKSKILEVSPITPLEVAWGKYLKSSDERILKIGPVIAHKTTTEQFERKYRGLIHESPLGFKNRGKGNSSFLSQVVSGNSTGLRDNQTLPVEEIEDDQDESKAIRDYFMIEEIPSSASSENAPTNTKISSKLFKRLGISNSKDKNSASEPVSQHPLEKGRTCTMLVTSFGRVLIFFRNDPEVNYRLISEVRLSYPFIQFKEVVTNSGRLSKILPTTGMFAIQSNVSTLTFEVEKYDVNHWTEALAKAQTNQF